jgi:hypothetical protein
LQINMFIALHSFQTQIHFLMRTSVGFKKL